MVLQYAHKSMKKYLIALTAFFLPLAAKAQDLGGGLLDKTAGDQAGYSKMPIELLVGNIISIALGILGLIFLVLTVYGGYIWMIARGDEAKVEKAKETMTNSIIGLAIVLGAYAITYFVVSGLIQGTLTK